MLSSKCYLQISAGKSGYRNIKWIVCSHEVYSKDSKESGLVFLSQNHEPSICSHRIPSLTLNLAIIVKKESLLNFECFLLWTQTEPPIKEQWKTLRQFVPLNPFLIHAYIWIILLFISFSSSHRYYLLMDLWWSHTLLTTPEFFSKCDSKSCGIWNNAVQCVGTAMPQELSMWYC